MKLLLMAIFAACFLALAAFIDDGILLDNISELYLLVLVSLTIFFALYLALFNEGQIKSKVENDENSTSDQITGQERSQEEE